MTYFRITATSSCEAGDGPVLGHRSARAPFPVRTMNASIVLVSHYPVGSILPTLLNPKHWPAPSAVLRPTGCLNILQADQGTSNVAIFDTETCFQRRALFAGAVAGIVSAMGLLFLHNDAPALGRFLTARVMAAVAVVAALLDGQWPSTPTSSIPVSPSVKAPPTTLCSRQLSSVSASELCCGCRHWHGSISSFPLPARRSQRPREGGRYADSVTSMKSTRQEASPPEISMRQ
jgi:hypothetical protein